MTCGEYLARHSDYLDDQLDAAGAAEMRRHAATCARCARYDRVLRRGLELLRREEPILPSCDRYVSLQRYLARVGSRAGQGAAPGTMVPRGPLAGTIAVAGVVALIAWGALCRAAGVPASASAGSAVQAAGLDPMQSWAAPVVRDADVLGPGRPVLGLGRARPAFSRAAVLDVAERTSAADPGPYTPLVVLPPDYGQAAGPPILAH
jgi:hypothetical protein